MKLIIVAAWVGPRPLEISLVETNHRNYARVHGYDYKVFGENDLGRTQSLVGNSADAHWIKPEVIRLALGTHDYVFWTDLDSVFHRHERSLQDIVDLKKDFVFTGDHNDLCNGGHLFFRNSDWTLNFLDDWAALRPVVFPKLSTSMQGSSGHVGDQVALNYLLGGGKPSQDEVSRTAFDIFNSTNGWEGNPDRRVRDFSRRIAPTRTRNMAEARRLIAPRLRSHVEIVSQPRLNAYPWWSDKSVSLRKGPIIHFVSPFKSDLMPYLEGNRPGRFGLIRGLLWHLRLKWLPKLASGLLVLAGLATRPAKRAVARISASTHKRSTI